MNSKTILRRNTIQKQLVIDSVRRLMNHPTADEVYNDVLSFYPSISKATVYRNLNTLSRDGNLLKISVPGSADKYDANMDGHYHAICRKCGKFIDLKTEARVNIDLNERVMKEHRVDDFLILFSGLCTACVTA